MDFNKKLQDGGGPGIFFKDVQKGRKPTDKTDKARELVISLRKQYLSLEDIKAALDAAGHLVREKAIHLILKSEGFARHKLYLLLN